MQNYDKTLVKHILKIIKLDTLYYFLQGTIFINRVAVTVEKDLFSLPPLSDSLDQAGVKIVEITPDSITQERKTQKALMYPIENKSENRYVKAMKYLNKGYRGFALARGNEVCGDIWYVGGRNDQKEPIHPDMEWLGIQCRNNEVYAFDMHLYPEQRGKNRAVLLQNGALHEIRKKGFTRAYGYYWAENISALWVHRTLKFKEVRRLKVTKLFFRHSFSV